MGTGWSQDEGSRSEGRAEQKQLSEPKPHQSPLAGKCVRNTLQPKPTGYEDNAVMNTSETTFKDANSKKPSPDKKSNNCFMLYSTDLSITWVEDHRYWKWSSVQETSGEVVDVAELLDVCWLEIHGKFDTAKLTPGVTYEVGFVIMLKDPAYGWEVPVNTRLSLSNGSCRKESKVNLMEKARGQWIKIPVGEFKAPVQKHGQIEFSIYEYAGGQWKRGLLIKGATIQPKN